MSQLPDCRQWVLTLTMLLLTHWLAGSGQVDAGLLEDRLNVNKVATKAFQLDSPPEPLPCISTERSGVVPCDNSVRCCLKGSPRIAGTNFCCPPGSNQYYFNSSLEFICACAV